MEGEVSKEGINEEESFLQDKNDLPKTQRDDTIATGIQNRELKRKKKKILRWSTRHSSSRTSVSFKKSIEIDANEYRII